MASGSAALTLNAVLHDNAFARTRNGSCETRPPMPPSMQVKPSTKLPLRLPEPYPLRATLSAPSHPADEAIPINTRARTPKVTVFAKPNAIEAVAAKNEQDAIVREGPNTSKIHPMGSCIAAYDQKKLDPNADDTRDAVMLNSL